jgi:metal-responsive CopG/Arc/MetJ family transcriptional regulator
VPKNQTAKLLKKGVSKEKILLVEFKAPKELVEAFDSKLKAQFSSRSEAIRSLMRAFLSET